MQATRREFIQAGLGCTAAIALNGNLSFAANTPMIPIAFQLFTVRAVFARDVPGTLRKLGEIGYKAVEFWDYGGTPDIYKTYSADELRKLLAASGLKCCGMHVKQEALSDANLHQTIENSHKLGSDYINLAMAQQLMKSEEGIAALAEILNKASTKCRAEKLTVGYHSHGFDFAKFNGKSAWEILFQQTSPEVNMQLDVGNCLSGDGDPVAMLKEFPGRTRTIHIKEFEEKTFDSPLYQEVFRLCETTSGTKWYIVEMGSQDGSGFDVPQEAFAKLRKLEKA